jgi:hypothetical protein
MAIDEKYPSVQIDTGEHTPIGEDEPVFVLQARDATSLKLLDAYADICNASGSPPAHLATILNSRQRFSAWQDANPELVKNPD